jgi:tetratricopeptide (TPR) repeat protein
MYRMRIQTQLASLLACSLFSISGAASVANGQRPSARRQSGAQVTTASEVNGLSPGAKNSLDAALAALQSNALNEAERDARAAVTASPRSAITHNVLGVVLDRSGRSDEAFNEFSTAIKLDPNFVSARNNLGRMLAEHGKTAQAIAEFERVLKSDPTHVQAHYNLGALYGDAGDFAKAAEHFAQARKADPNDPELALAFLNVAYRADRTKEAEAATDLVERVAGADAKSLFTLATVLAESKQYERTARLLTRVNNLTPHTYEVLYNLGIALYNLDRNDEAAMYLAEAADLNPAPLETHLRLGLIASAGNDRANAITEFKHVLERDAKQASYHYLLGREYFRVGYWDGAISEYSAAFELQPKEVTYVLARADAFYRKGEWTASAADFDRAAMLDPKRSDIEYWQGYAYRAAGNFDRAREFLERFLSRNPDSVDALASLGYVAIEQGRLEDAEIPLKHALSLDPNNVPVLYDYARLAVKQRKLTEAAQRLQQVLARSPSHTSAHYQLFLVYSRLKQAGQAQAELAEFKRLDALEKESTRERSADEKLRIQQMLNQLP